MKIKTVLTVAGSDPSGGAGIQADLATIFAHGLFGMSAITAVTAQNTAGFFGTEKVSADMVEKQLDAVFTDIFPDAVKIGMLADRRTAEAVAGKLEFYKAKNIVLDPVMVSSSGAQLLEDGAVQLLVEKLMPMARLVTPNIPECERLLGMKIIGREDMEKAAETLSRRIGTAVLLKGGHSSGDCSDLLFENGRGKWFDEKRIDNPNTHGTGCTLSSAVACGLAVGKDLSESVLSAKKYLTAAVSAGLDLGKGSGPLLHQP